LAYGLPVITDRKSYELGCFQGYFENGKNCFIGKIRRAIVEFINDHTREQYLGLRRNTTACANVYHLPYPEKDKKRFRKFLGGIAS